MWPRGKNLGYFINKNESDMKLKLCFNKSVNFLKTLSLDLAGPDILILDPKHIQCGWDRKKKNQ